MKRDGNSPVPPGTRRKDLLKNARIRSWHEARSLKSHLSADVDLRKLGLLLERIRLDPESVVVVASKDPDRLQEVLIRYATDRKREGLVDDYIAKTLSGLKSYLRFRRVRFDGYPVLAPIRGSTLANERVPTPEELGRVLERLSLRGKTIALTMAHSGVRPQALGDYEGQRGIALGDLPELELRAQPKFREIPFVVRVSAELSKTRQAYTTFGTAQQAAVILSYIAERRAGGEKLGPDSPLVARTPTEELRGATKESASRGRKFMVTGAIVREVAEMLHASQPEGVSWRTYVLRSYCSTRLLLGPMNRDLREAILGHDTGIAGRYNVGKRWGEELLSEARREFANSAYLLETSQTTKTDVRRTVLEDLLRAVEKGTGQKSKEAGLTAEDLGKAIRTLLGRTAAGDAEEAGSRLPAVSVPSESSRPQQKTISPGELDAMLERGWRYVATVGERVVIEPSIERVG